ncbi:hypothetical protein HMPREF0542_10564 [Ligilactobacillus ruminis ATCC 25644]|jgi:hypothetical protein|uniref:Uncharacterized protein n=1 Tax=Ligilactobacillus ruminis ATCC 25644 TaxID=525362 RepID=E7FNT7_9LACO|nr:hypothetical protein HMPREF0542_10564 [Ligilactobacillus ruminis ATCC 25644]EGX97815.1 hypothetical protein ANHS_1576 [Ligilactobacillus ruminis ATCC 25644]
MIDSTFQKLASAAETIREYVGVHHGFQRTFLNLGLKHCNISIAVILEVFR